MQYFNFSNDTHVATFLKYSMRQAQSNPEFPIHFLALRDDRPPEVKEEIKKQHERLAQMTQGLDDRLITIFFRFVYPTYPIVNQREFLKAYKTDRTSIDICLLSGLYAISCIWWKYDKYELCQKPIPLGFYDRLFNECRIAVERSLKYPTLGTIQGLLLLSQKNISSTDIPSTFSSSIDISVIVALSHRLGLHLDCSTWSIPALEKRLRKRLWAVIYLVEKWNSANLGVPSLLSESNTTWDYYSEDAPTLQLFVHFCKLTTILDAVVREFYSVRGYSERYRDSKTTIVRVELYLKKLHEWRNNLPDQLKSTEYYEPGEPSKNGILHLAELTIAVLLLRLKIHPSCTGSIDRETNFKYRQQAATTIQRVIKYTTEIDHWHLHSFWHSMVNLNFCTLVSFFLLFKVTATSSKEHKDVVDAFKKWENSLKQLAKSWDSGAGLSTVKINTMLFFRKDLINVPDPTTAMSDPNTPVANSPYPELVRYTTQTDEINKRQEEEERVRKAELAKRLEEEHALRLEEERRRQNARLQKDRDGRAAQNALGRGTQKTLESASEPLSHRTAKSKSTLVDITALQNQFPYYEQEQEFQIPPVRTQSMHLSRPSQSGGMFPFDSGYRPTSTHSSPTLPHENAISSPISIKSAFAAAGGKLSRENSRGSDGNAEEVVETGHDFRNSNFYSNFISQSLKQEKENVRSSGGGLANTHPPSYMSFDDKSPPSPFQEVASTQLPQQLPTQASPLSIHSASPLENSPGLHYPKNSDGNVGGTFDVPSSPAMGQYSVPDPVVSFSSNNTPPSNPAVNRPPSSSNPPAQKMQQQQRKRLSMPSSVAPRGSNSAPKTSNSLDGTTNSNTPTSSTGDPATESYRRHSVVSDHVMNQYKQMLEFHKNQSALQSFTPPPPSQGQNGGARQNSQQSPVQPPLVQQQSRSQPQHQSQQKQQPLSQPQPQSQIQPQQQPRSTLQNGSAGPSGIQNSIQNQSQSSMQPNHGQPRGFTGQQHQDKDDFLDAYTKMTELSTLKYQRGHQLPTNPNGLPNLSNLSHQQKVNLQQHLQQMLLHNAPISPALVANLLHEQDNAGHVGLRKGNSPSSIANNGGPDSQQQLGNSGVGVGNGINNAVNMRDLNHQHNIMNNIGNSMRNSNASNIQPGSMNTTGQQMQYQRSLNQDTHAGSSRLEGHNNNINNNNSSNFDDMEFWNDMGSMHTIDNMDGLHNVDSNMEFPTDLDEVMLNHNWDTNFSYQQQ